MYDVGWNAKRACGLLASVLLLAVGGQARAWEKDGLRLRGRLMTRYEWKDEEARTGRWTDTLSLHRARLDARWDPAKPLRLQLEFELADGFELADAYLRYRFKKYLQLTAGHFKKPLSRLRLTSRWDLLIPRRGMLDNQAIGGSLFGGFGGRDAGLMLSGRVGKGTRLEYFAGVFDGSGFLGWAFQDPDDPPRADNATHRDYVGRLLLRAFPGLEFAASYCHKRAGILYAPGEENDRSFNLIEADAAWRWAGLALELEGAWGDNPNAMAGHKLLGGHAIAAWRLELSERLALLTAFMVEALDPDDHAGGGRALRLAGALSLELDGRLRLVLSAEGGFGELRYQVPEYYSQSDLRSVDKYRFVPTRALLQLNATL